MPEVWQMLDVSPSGTITVETLADFQRDLQPVEAEAEWEAGDERERSGRILKYQIQAVGGATPSNLVINQILGGTQGTEFLVKLAHAGDTATWVFDATKIANSDGFDIEINNVFSMLHFVNIDGVVYAPVRL